MKSTKELKKEKKILEDNIKSEQDMIDNNEHYDNDETNMSYGPDHYKRAIEYDKKDLDDVTSEINRRKKVQQLKKAADEALKGVKTLK